MYTLYKYIYPTKNNKNPNDWTYVHQLSSRKRRVPVGTPLESCYGARWISSRPAGQSSRGHSSTGKSIAQTLVHGENMRKLQAYRNVRKCQKMSKNVKKCQKIFKIQKFTRDKLENQVSSSPSLQVSRLWSRANEPARGVRQENLLGHDACDVAVRKHW